MDKYHFIEIEIYKRLAIYKIQAIKFPLAQNKQTNKQTNKQQQSVDTASTRLEGTFGTETKFSITF